jgi:peptidoglycan L-alanyl-D-glutamate endopeptidase CwlK
MLKDLEGGRTEYPFETVRTEERQDFLYGFGREYDDGRGKVTSAETALASWHGFGLAVDIVEKDNTPWDAPPGFWESIGIAARKRGLAWGGLWKKPDLPHVQWGRCPKSPTEDDRRLFRQMGREAVWVKYGAA